MPPYIPDRISSAMIPYPEGNFSACLIPNGLSISKDYYNAAKSMGASPFIIFKDVIFPAALPDILTGARLAISNGWMSVI